MDKRFAITLVLIVAVLVGWNMLVVPRFAPPPAPPVAPTTQPAAAAGGGAAAGGAAASQPATAAPVAPASRPVFVSTAPPIVLENKYLRVTLTEAGAVATSIVLKEFKREPGKEEPLELLHPFAKLPQALELKALDDAQALLEARIWRVDRAGDGQAISFVMEPGQSGFMGDYRIVKRIGLAPEAHHLDVTLELTLAAGAPDRSDARFIFTPTSGLAVDAEVYGIHDTNELRSITYQLDADKGSTFSASKVMELTKATTVDPDGCHRTVAAFNGTHRYVADVSRFFGIYTALIAVEPKTIASVVGIVDPDFLPKADARCTRTRTEITWGWKPGRDAAAPGATQKMAIYCGPNDEHEVKAALTGDLAPWADEFSRVYNDGLGYAAWISRAVLWILGMVHKATGNWGWAIVGLTLIVRLCLFPINRRSQLAMLRHSEGMARIKPKLDALKEKHKADMPTFMREQKALMQAEKMPMFPLGGCLPLFLQLPVFSGLMGALGSAVSLRQAPFLWVKDLSQPDHLVRFSANVWNPMSGIPCCCMPKGGMSESISGLHLLPILMTIAWFVNQSLMPKPQNESPEMAQQRKMMLAMPLLFGFMMYSYAAGLSLYWLTSSIVGAFESRIIKRSLPPRAGPTIITVK